MGYTPMLEAARWGNQELVQLLHDNGVTLNYEAFACCVGACGQRPTVGYLAFLLYPHPMSHFCLARQGI